MEIEPKVAVKKPTAKRPARRVVKWIVNCVETGSYFFSLGPCRGFSFRDMYRKTIGFGELIFNRSQKGRKKDLKSRKELFEFTCVNLYYYSVIKFEQCYYYNLVLNTFLRRGQTNRILKNAYIYSISLTPT